MAKNHGHGKASIFTPQEYERVRRQIRNPTHRLLFDIARNTGERIGAIRQLRVDDVYQVNGHPRDCITFRASTRKAAPDGKRQTRECPVRSQLADLLSGYHPPPSGFLFPGPDGHPVSHSAVDAWLRRAIAKAGLGHRGFSTHSFRRTLITRLSEGGTDIKTIQGVTGHRDLKVLLGYVEIDQRRVLRAMEGVTV